MLGNVLVYGKSMGRTYVDVGLKRRVLLREIDGVEMPKPGSRVSLDVTEKGKKGALFSSAYDVLSEPSFKAAFSNNKRYLLLGSWEGDIFKHHLFDRWAHRDFSSGFFGDKYALVKPSGYSFAKQLSSQDITEVPLDNFKFGCLSRDAGFNDESYSGQIDWLIKNEV